MFLRGRRRDNPGLATAARPTIPDVVAWEIHRRAVTDGDAGAWALLARDDQFVQALTEALKAVPTAVLLASLRTELNWYDGGEGGGGEPPAAHRRTHGAEAEDHQRPGAGFRHCRQIGGVGNVVDGERTAAAAQATEDDAVEALL